MVIDGELDPSRALTYSNEEEFFDVRASTGDEEECTNGGGGGLRHAFRLFYNHTSSDAECIPYKFFDSYILTFKNNLHTKRK